ncbi:hypothetical protein [Marinitoga lauensis]|uniref:hypothetical protein n=1 Tax=Marinitoga lauensis TaxID=2201189 RepID=UPI001010A592|nr:hypothetical protein [Marinitoga lauensis]
MFTDIFYSIYKYADIETPPSTNSKRLEITIQASRVIIDFEKKEYTDSLNNLKYLLSNIFKNYYQRRIYLIANNCQILDESGTIVNSAFFDWSENLKVKILKDNLIFNIP